METKCRSKQCRFITDRFIVGLNNIEKHWNKYSDRGINMRLIDADKLSFRCAYNGDCIANEEKCKKCADYVCDFEEIQNQATIDLQKVEKKND